MSQKNQQRANKTESGINLDGIDELLKGFSGPEAIMGRGGLIEQLTKAVLERALRGELIHHLVYAKGEEPPQGSEAEGEAANSRNGYSKKPLTGEAGYMGIAVLRDRQGSFEPQLIRKGQRRFEGFDERIIAMYGRGMTVREIQGFLLDQYKVELSPEFISAVTDSVLEEVSEWQNRPLERLYPVVFFDAFRVKIRDEGTVKNKAIELNEKSNGKLLEVHVTGKLTSKDYERFLPEVERLLEQHGKIDILFSMSDFHGWEVGAAWEDTKFAFRHFSDIGRLAIVGEQKWQEWMTVACRPFTKAEIRYFDHAQAAKALAWLEAE